MKLKTFLTILLFTTTVLTSRTIVFAATKDTNTIYLQIGDKTLTATLVDNSATKALKESLAKNSITINMSDYGGFEKVGSLGVSFPTSNENITTESGDLILYQGNQLVIFYGSNSWSYTRLGKINDVTQSELKDIFGSGNVTITLSINNFREVPKTCFPNLTSVFLTIVVLCVISTAF